MPRPNELPVDKKAIKALVTLFGPREAARQAGINPNTVIGWCARYKWKKALVSGDEPKDAADMIRDILQRTRKNTTLHLATYAEKAAAQASESLNPLEDARKVRDVASVYNTLWPHNEGKELIEGAILIGKLEVKDLPEGEVIEVTDEDIREELPHGGSQSN